MRGRGVAEPFRVGTGGRGCVGGLRGLETEVDEIVRIRVPGIVLVRLNLEGILRREGAGNGGRDLFLSTAIPVGFRDDGSSAGVLGVGILKLDAVEGVLRVSMWVLSYTTPVR